MYHRVFQCFRSDMVSFRGKQRLFCSITLLISSLLYGYVGYSAETSDAKALFIKGASLFEEGKYDDAYDAFNESYHRQPVATALYNVAMCEMILGRYVESFASFKKLMEESGNILKPGLLQKVKESIEKLETLVGYLRLVELPGNAQLWIDGQLIDNINSDHSIRVNPGRYNIQVTLEGHYPYEASIYIKSGTSVTLQPLLSKKSLPSTETESISSTASFTKSSVESAVRPQQDTSSPSNKRVLSSDRTNLNLHSTSSGWFISGLAVTIVGVVGVGVGGLSTWKQYQSKEDALVANSKLNRDSDYETYSADYADIRSEFNRAHIGMKIGYITGSALIVTGVTLMVIVKRKGRKKLKKSHLRAAYSGVEFVF